MPASNGARRQSLLPTKEHEKSPHKIDIVDATLLAMIPMLRGA